MPRSLKWLRSDNIREVIFQYWTIWEPILTIKIFSQKNYKALSLCRKDDLTTKTSYSVIGNYSGIRKFSFGILIIMTHRFILYMQGKRRNKKRTITLQHKFWHLNSIFN